MATAVVPELLAKKRKRDEQWAAERAAAAVDARKKARASRKDIFKRAESYVKEFRAQVRGGTSWRRRVCHGREAAGAWGVAAPQEEHSMAGEVKPLPKAAAGRGGGPMAGPWQVKRLAALGVKSADLGACTAFGALGWLRGRRGRRAAAACSPACSRIRAARR